MSSPSRRLVYPVGKYAAFNLMIARLLYEVTERPGDLVYVTLGGTELFDAANFCWALGGSISQVVTYKSDAGRYKSAEVACERFTSLGVNARAVRADIFDFERENDSAHVFFVDLFGVCTGQPYVARFRRWFEDGILRAGDALLVTSHLGHRAKNMVEWYDTEFRILGVSNRDERIDTFKKLHPAFVVYRALSAAYYNGSISITNLGSIRYSESSPMGIYGYVFSDGSADFESLVRNAPEFDVRLRTWVM